MKKNHQHLAMFEWQKNSLELTYYINERKRFVELAFLILKETCSNNHLFFFIFRFSGNPLQRLFSPVSWIC